VDTIQAGPLRELILRETLLFANPLDSFAYDSIDIRLQSSRVECSWTTIRADSKLANFVRMSASSLAVTSAKGVRSERQFP